MPLEDVPLVEFMYLVFTRMPGVSYRRRLRSLLCFCDVFRALINSLVCWSMTCSSRARALANDWSSAVSTWMGAHSEPASLSGTFLVSWEFSGPYGSGWRKDVVNRCSEFGMGSDRYVQGMEPAPRFRQSTSVPHSSIAFRHLFPNSARFGYTFSFMVLYVHGGEMAY